MKRGLAKWHGPAVMALVMATAGAARAADDGFDVGASVPSFTLKAVNPEDSGESYVSIDKYYGTGAEAPKKATLISFFATYCEPCKKEMPFLAALYDEYKDDGLQVLSITIDKEKDKIEFAKSLAQESGVNFPVLSDRFNIVAKRYFIEKLPNVYVLDSEGKVSLVKVGYAGGVTRDLLNEVRKNIGEPTSDPVPESLAPFMQHGPEAAGDDEPTEGEVATAKEEEKTKAKRRRRRRRRRRR